MDTPIDATLFLKRFSIQNNNLLKKLDVFYNFVFYFDAVQFKLLIFKLKTTKKYNWSNRESSKEGTPLLELIDYVKNK